MSEGGKAGKSDAVRSELEQAGAVWGGDLKDLEATTARMRQVMVRGQLVHEIARALIAPVERVLGTEAAELLASSADRCAAELAGELLGPDRLAAADVARLIRATLVPPLEVGWWLTPLGQAVADASETADSETVTQVEAARMLGVNRSAVSQLVKRGTLRSSTDGKPLLSAVLDRLLKGSR